MKAPPMQSICNKGTASSQRFPMVSRINSFEIIAKPNIAGKDRKAVKRSIFRNTRTERPCSSFTEASTGCATCPTAFATNALAIVFHL